MFAYDGSKRPTVEELKSHPWMSKPTDIKGIRGDLVERLSASRSEKTAASSNADGSRRAGKGTDQRLALVREAVSESNLKNYTFNDKTDFITQCDPGYIVELIEAFNAEHANGELQLEINDEK